MQESVFKKEIQTEIDDTEVTIRMVNLHKLDRNIEALEWASRNCPFQYTAAIFDSLNIIKYICKNATKIKEAKPAHQPTEQSMPLFVGGAGSKYCTKCGYSVVECACHLQ
jgi:hypothetical protein